MQDTANGFEKMLVISHKRSMACGCEMPVTGMWQFDDLWQSSVRGFDVCEITTLTLACLAEHFQPESRAKWRSTLIYRMKPRISPQPLSEALQRGLVLPRVARCATMLRMRMRLMFMWLTEQ